MALAAPALSSAMRAKLLEHSASQAIDGAALTAMCDALAEAIVTYLVASTVVVPTGMFATDPISGPLPITGAGTIS